MHGTKLKIIIPKFIEGSTCFVRYTAHHQELQTVTQFGNPDDERYAV
jgi:hypothetical protein